MPMFCKKPVVIEARQMPSDDTFQSDDAAMLVLVEIPAWCGGEAVIDAFGPCILIDTLEGQMRADPGDWIIRGVKGEFYPCKPDIFAATYEAA